jgi:hypothetical protein
MRSYMIPQAIPPKYIGVTMDQSTMPATADQPSIAPQLNVRAVVSAHPFLFPRHAKAEERRDYCIGRLTKEYLWVVCDSFH